MLDLPVALSSEDNSYSLTPVNDGRDLAIKTTVGPVMLYKREVKET